MKVRKYGLYELILKSEHETGLLNFAIGINLFELQLMIQFVHFVFLEKVGFCFVWFCFSPLHVNNEYQVL